MTLRYGRHLLVFSLLLPLLAVLSVAPAFAQPAAGLNAALTGLRSPNPGIRVRAFDELLALTSQASGTIPSRVRGLMTQHPEQADRIKTTLIAALDRDAAYVRSLESGRARMSEQFSDYWSNLMWAVAGFRDPRTVNGLLAGVDTGDIALHGLADLCPFSVDPLIAESARPTASSRRRASALNALGECLKRAPAIEPSGQALAKVRQAAMKALRDPDAIVRKAAASILAQRR
jgi:hypothetical protein